MYQSDVQNLINNITKGVLWAFLVRSDVMDTNWELKHKTQPLTTSPRFSLALWDVRDEGSVFSFPEKMNYMFISRDRLQIL